MASFVQDNMVNIDNAFLPIQFINHNTNGLVTICSFIISFTLTTPPPSHHITIESIDIALQDSQKKLDNKDIIANV